ncbi:HU family DNA-binding protein [Fusobacterium varium]|uniref:HU family DNA-binding protein n=1 Tax=Fusobacterium varium TaxID=856 RepID=UPI0027DEA759|nr:HU family DNA-binding protein [uncultured Fusobacterium sp.]
MNKKELAKIYKEVSNGEVSARKAVKKINIFLETLQEALQIDGTVVFINRGIFEIKERNSRIISNPVTRERMNIHPKKTVKFRVSKNMNN